MVEYRNVLATKLKNIWEDSEENKRETWNKVADYVLDNYVSKESLISDTSIGLFGARQLYPLLGLEKDATLEKCKEEISRLKEIEKLWNEKNDQSWQEKAKEALCSGIFVSGKPQKIEKTQYVDTKQYIATIENIIRKQNELIDAVNYLLERSK